MRDRLILRFIIVVASLLAIGSSVANAADTAPAAILQDLRSFSRLGTVLMVAAHPDDAALVAAWRSQAELIRARYGAVANEQLPRQLNLARLARRKRRGMAAMAMLHVVEAGARWHDHSSVNHLHFDFFPLAEAHAANRANPRAPVS